MISWLVLLPLSHALVLNSAPSSAPAAHSFDQLLDLLLDEKHFRSQLEQQVQELRDELSIEKLAFDLQRNKTLTELEAFQRAFIKEKSNRFHLEQAYTRLTMDFHHLSLEHSVLKKMYTNLETDFHNVTKSNNRLDKYVQNVSAKHDILEGKHDALAKLNAELVEKVKNQSAESTANKQTIAITTNGINELNQTSITMLNGVRTELAANHADIASNRINIGTNRADVATNKADIVTIQADVTVLKRKQGNYLFVFWKLHKES